MTSKAVASSTQQSLLGEGLRWDARRAELLGVDILNVATATEGWSDEQRRAERTAGLIYRFDTDAQGRPAALFRPDATWWATVAL